jgi:putative spermidine/putrescine transport system permease protein
MALPSYAGPLETIWYYAYRVICTAIFFFLIAPIIVIIPLSFNAEPYFTFTPEMLSLQADAFSLRWYQDIVYNDQWLHSIKNSFIIGIASTLIATSLGTLAALGLSRAELPAKSLIMGILISPMIVPLIITAAAMFFFYSAPFGSSELALAQTYAGVILAHAALGTPSP